MLHKYILVIFIVCLSMYSCKNKNKETLPDKPPQNTEPLKTENMKEAGKKDGAINTAVGSPSAPSIPAVIKSDNKSELGFQSSGVVTKIYVKAGDFVKKGEILAQLDNTQSLLDVKNEKLDLESKRLAYELESKKYARNLEQFKAGILSRGAIDNEKNNLDSVKVNYKSAQTNLESKQYALKLTHLTAPFSGVIAQSYKSIGDFVSPGTPVFDLVQSDALSVYAQVPILFYSQIKQGMVFAATDSSRQYKGQIKIKKIVPVIGSGSSTFDIYAEIKEFNRKLIPGEYVEILL